MADHLAQMLAHTQKQQICIYIDLALQTAAPILISFPFELRAFVLVYVSIKFAVLWLKRGCCVPFLFNTLILI